MPHIQQIINNLNLTLKLHLLSLKVHFLPLSLYSIITLTFCLKLRANSNVWSSPGRREYHFIQSLSYFIIHLQLYQYQKNCNFSGKLCNLSVKLILFIICWMWGSFLFWKCMKFYATVKNDKCMKFDGTEWVSLFYFIIILFNLSLTLSSIYNFTNIRKIVLLVANCVI